LAKIAVELEMAVGQRAANGAQGGMIVRQLAEGEGWNVSDVICTSGPHDRPFEESHGQVNIAVVVAGSFQYRADRGHELMAPGSLLLGNPGQPFECGHEHGTGDRCISFGYTQEYFELLAVDVGEHNPRRFFQVFRLPPLRELSPVVARACTGLVGGGAVSWRQMVWEELSLQLAAQALHLANGGTPNWGGAPPSTVARVTRAIRRIERHPESGVSVEALAREAKLSPYHFLRTFQTLTGVTPHQYVLRMRLREAAVRLAAEPGQVLEIAMDCGFGDVSNFNRNFRTEFGVSPRVYRSQSPAVPRRD
jgi:AraC family transcriptional regulator